MRRSGAASCNCVVTVYQPAAPDDRRNTTGLCYAARRPAAPSTFLSCGSLPGGGFFALQSAAASRAGIPPLAGGPSWTDGEPPHDWYRARSACNTLLSTRFGAGVCSACLRRASGNIETYLHRHDRKFEPPRQHPRHSGSPLLSTHRLRGLPSWTLLEGRGRL
jgi:hypothetical protein